MSNKPSKSRPPVNRYLKYSGIGFNLAALLLIAVYSGQYLDRKYQLAKPWFTIVLMLAALGAWFTKLLRDLKYDDEQDRRR